MYYPGWDIFLSVLYLAIIGWETSSISRLNWRLVTLIAFIWLGPGVVLTLITISGVNFMGLGDYAIFILEFWYTPLVPLLSLTTMIIAGKPLYYYLLILMPLFMGLYFYLSLQLPAYINCTVKNKTTSFHDHADK